MRRALVLLALLACPREAYARDSALESELRVARSSYEGYRRPTFTVVSLALGLSAPHAAIFATINAGSAAADEAPTVGHEPAKRLIAVGLEPQVRAPLGP